MKSSQVFSGSVLTFVTRIGTFVLNFFTLILVTRALGPENVGVYALLTLVPVTLAGFGMPSIGIANVYFSGQGKYELSKIASNSLVGVIFFSVVLWGLVGLISLLPVSNIVLTSRGINSAQLWLVVTALPFYVLSKWNSGILRGVGQIGLFNIVAFSGVLVQFLIVVIFALLGTLNLLDVLLSFVLSNLGAAIVALALVWRLTSIRFSLDWPLARAMLRYSVKAYLWNALYFLDNRSTLILGAILISSTELGYYSVAASVTEKLWFITEPVVTVLFPYISAANQQKKTDHITSAICRCAFLLTATISLCIGVFAGSLVTLMFGAEFIPAVQPLRILLSGVAMVSVARLIAVDFAGRGHPEMGALSALISLLASVVLILLLAPGYGLIGIAFATTVGYLAATVLMVILFSKKHHIPAWDVVVPKRADWQNVKSMAGVWLRVLPRVVKLEK